MHAKRSTNVLQSLMHIISGNRIVNKGLPTRHSIPTTYITLYAHTFHSIAAAAVLHSSLSGRPFMSLLLLLVGAFSVIFLLPS